MFTFIPALLEKLDTQPGPPTEMELQELYVSNSPILAEYTRLTLQSYESQRNVISKEPKLQDDRVHPEDGGRTFFRNALIHQSDCILLQPKAQQCTVILNV